MLTNFLRKQPAFIYIAFFYSLILFIWLVFSLLIEITNINDIIFSEAPSLAKDGVVGIIIKGVIIAPLIETLIFQKLVYYLFSKLPYLKNRNLFSCVVSGILFGLSHIYSLHYIIVTTIVGFVLMYAYLVQINNLRKSFWLVVVIHSLLNLTGLLKELFLQ